MIEPANVVEEPTTPILTVQTENIKEKPVPVTEVVEAVKEAPKTMSNEEKLAAIRAKLAALNKK